MNILRRNFLAFLPAIPSLFLGKNKETITSEMMFVTDSNGDILGIINDRVRYRRKNETFFNAIRTIETYYDENGVWHRDEEDGPACIKKQNNKVTYIAYLNHGLYHRSVDMPAIIQYNDMEVTQTVQYCKNGDWHRENGPAMIFANGYKQYYLNGNRILKDEEDND